MNKHESNKIKENSNTVRHLIMGQITTTQNLVAIKEIRHAGQQQWPQSTGIQESNILKFIHPVSCSLSTWRCMEPGHWTTALVMIYLVHDIPHDKKLPTVSSLPMFLSGVKPSCSTVWHDTGCWNLPWNKKSCSSSALISNYTHHTVWDEIITYISNLNFNDATAEVWEWISNFIPHFTDHVITHPC